MNTHLRHLIQELRAEGWNYVATQTNGAPHFVHPQFGKVTVASTPADWEDECNYTRQRIRKTSRRAQGLVPASAPPNDALQGVFAEIDVLEQEWAQLQSAIPRLLGDLRTLLTPIYTNMVEERRAMLALLEKQICSPHWKRKQVQQLEDLCLLIADTTINRLEVNLEEEFPFLNTLRTDHSHQDQEEESEALEDPFAGFDAEAWERWFAAQESNTTYHPKAKARQAAKPNSQSEKYLSNVPPKSSRALERKIYLGLARELHPDKTTDATERIQRTHLMKQLNTAYTKRDLRTLLALLHGHSTVPSHASFDVETLKILAKSLEEQRHSLQERIRKEIGNLPAIEGDWRTLLTQPKAREIFLRKERRATEAEWQRLRAIRNKLRESQEIAQLLRRTGIDDWMQVF